MEILPVCLTLYFDGLSFDGQLQRSAEKADSGMVNVAAGAAIARQGIASAPGALIGERPSTSGRRSFHRDELDENFAARVPADWTRCCRASQCERLEQARADPE
jgi:hypothetical protein